MLKKEKQISCLCFKKSLRLWKQVIPLTILNGKGWHYLTVKKLSALRWFLLSGFPSFLEQKANLNRVKKCKNKDFCNVIMPSEDTKILKHNWYQKSDKAPFIIYADLEYVIEKIDGCKNNSENSSTTKASKHIPSGFSMSAISSFRSIENKHDVYRGKDYIRKFYEFL